ncbi:thymidylate kinase [Streptomyces sp. NBC_00335]|uniref:dTMP kinase n=1 Tax=unclassified Streptomyces TaxID=2593676 RepID=UPI00224CEF20|nr:MULTISPECIES: dTMP kinase [unclassified Streptomyces]MCX5409879.1 thymidylate kinase [Streptomyces sp. NBC_00086]
MTRTRRTPLPGPASTSASRTATLEELDRHLRNEGRLVHRTCEPTHSSLGQFTRTSASFLNGHALACLVAANRYEHVHNELLPMCEAGFTVLSDRYLASSLVLQRLDGVFEQFVLDLHREVLLPDLSVILTAEPAVIAARLAARGIRHRFHLDPDAPRREIELYGEAARTLTAMGVRVLVIDSTTTTPKDVARRIADALPPDGSTVHSAPVPTQAPAPPDPTSTR